jgi:hypothetical protein
MAPTYFTHPKLLPWRWRDRLVVLSFLLLHLAPTNTTAAHQWNNEWLKGNTYRSRAFIIAENVSIGEFPLNRERRSAVHEILNFIGRDYAVDSKMHRAMFIGSDLPSIISSSDN